LLPISSGSFVECGFRWLGVGELLGLCIVSLGVEYPNDMIGGKNIWLKRVKRL
jgi:hypothetical protein